MDGGPTEDGRMTPYFEVHCDTVARNCEAMRAVAQTLGVGLRPHVKTHKTVEGALLQVGGRRDAGVVASTAAEVRLLAGAGFRDITYGVPVAPAKLDALLDAAGAAELTFLVDGRAAAEALAAHPRAPLQAFVKVDGGYHRAGVRPAAAADVAAWAAALAGRVLWRGVYAHSGDAYAASPCANGCSNDEALAATRREAAAASAVARALRAAGVASPIVAIGSTPAAGALRRRVADVADVADVAVAGGRGLDLGLDLVNEIHPGNYVFYDRHQLEIGACGPDEVAVRVVARVVGVYPERNEALVDAGALALSKDPGPAHLYREPGAAPCGYGLVDGMPDVCVASLSQEVGKLTSRSGAPLPWDKLRLGALVRIMPNHSCLAAACFHEYVVVGGGRAELRWAPCHGWL